MALDRSAIFGSRGYSRCALGRRESARAKILMEVVTLPRSHFPMKSTIFLGAEVVEFLTRDIYYRLAVMPKHNSRW